MAEVEIPNPDEIKEKAEDPFSKTVALFVAIYAVILAFAAAGGNNAGKDMMMNQQEASNQWAFFQAKSIREALYIVESEKLEFELAKGADITPAAKTQALKSLERIKGKLDEYKTEKKEIAEKAKKHEEERDLARRKDPYFDFAEVMLQIAIVFASVAMLSGKKWAFLASMGLAILGSFLTANGYFLFVKIGFLEH